MNANALKQPKANASTSESRCRNCGNETVSIATITYDAEVRHDGRLYEFTIPKLRIPVCTTCGEKVFTEEVDEQFNAHLRSHLNLLTPDEIRSALNRVSLTQKMAAEQMGIAEATLSRWLTGTQIQSRSMDNLLRIFFAFPQVRQALGSEHPDPLFGTRDFAGSV